MPNLKMNLLENSISFFMESVTKAVQAETDEDKWKFAILLLVQAIETSLKERLRRTHEIFVYSNIDKPRHTVDLSLAIERLEKISKINLKQPDLKCIKTASELNGTYLRFWAWPYFLISSLACTRGFINKAKGLGLRFMARGSTLPGLLPTVFSAINVNNTASDSSSIMATC